MLANLKITFLSLIFLSVTLMSYAQEEAVDTPFKRLTNIVITAFEHSTTQSTVVSRVIFPFESADRKLSLVSALNTIPGVHMEERSPGSYRINIRGSSLRSPFGVRNVKIYWNDLPVTDPGGNTYFNQFAYNNFESIDITKGPASSMYGAGTGGLILMRSSQFRKPKVDFEYTGGSYNLQNISTTVAFGERDHQNIITYAHNESDGYRDHSKMRRDNFSWVNKNLKEGRYELTSSFLYTHLKYETPGALTLTEFRNNPKNARPAVGSLPSAVTAAASIDQQNVLAGIASRYTIFPEITNATSLYGAFAQITNPTFRNYEHRSEPHFGGRSTFIWKKKSGETAWQVLAGSELQYGFFNTTTSKNKQGNRDTLLTNDDIKYTVSSIFMQGDMILKGSWFITAGLSSGTNNVSITRVNKYPVLNQSRKYKDEYSPRISITRKFKDFSISAIVSRGYSPPGIGELLPSTSIISTNLEAEHGTNYELKGAYSILNNSLRFSFESFYFKLNDALVQRRDATGADFFVNAGDVNQEGIEFTTDYLKVFHSPTFDHITAKLAWALEDFKYGDIRKDTTLLTGKHLPGVPSNTLSLVTDLTLKKHWYVNISNYYSSKIFLNDANTSIANAYLLLGCKIGWKVMPWKNISMNIYAGADNLLDETYSLGNDINDLNGRFYNAAARRNYYAGLAFSFDTN